MRMTKGKRESLISQKPDIPVCHPVYQSSQAKARFVQKASLKAKMSLWRVFPLSGQFLPR